jgi:transcriptional regulator with XRE-family HTH domain
MLENKDYAPPTTPDGFPQRLRQVVDSYGSTNALARVIDRSEGALRKWLRGQSEPAVSDLRAICDATNTSVEWLVMGRGPQKGSAMRSPPSGSEGGEDEPLGKLNFSLMDDVVGTVGLEGTIDGVQLTADKCSTILTLVYNMSIPTRRVDRESARRAVGLALR